MWSNYHLYLNIAFDINLSRSCDSQALKVFLNSLPELVQNGEYNYTSSAGLPGFTLLMLNAPSYGSWSELNIDPIQTNLLAIVCSKDRFDELKSLCIKIASFLQWQLINETTDDEIDNFVIWSPAK